MCLFELWFSPGICPVVGFPCGSAGKESTCNTRELGSIPGLGRSPGEGKGYPLQYSWASLVAQLVKNPPVTRESWVRSRGWEDPLEKGKATHSSILAWRIPWIIEKAREFQKNIYFCFIDYAKSFDCVYHNKLENS